MWALGVDFGGTTAKIAAIDDQANLLSEHSLPTGEDCRPEPLIEQLSRVILEINRSLSAESSNNHSVACSIGIGFPGIHTFASGIIHFSPNLPHWREVPIKTLLEAKTGLPVYLNNDANMAALGEYWAGVGSKVAAGGKPVKNFVFLTLGTGVGSGAIIDDRLLTGSNDSAPEFGHMTILPDGPFCNCGSRGCVEILCSKVGIERRLDRELCKHPESSLASLVREEITPEVIYCHGIAGDSYARKIYEDIGFYLGIAIANIINSLNPEVVALGGGISGALDLMIDKLNKTVKCYALKRPRENCKILPAELKTRAGIFGAAGWAIRNQKSTQE